jgi:hypothetical protein
MDYITRSCVWLGNPNGRRYKIQDDKIRDKGKIVPSG